MIRYSRLFIFVAFIMVGLLSSCSQGHKSIKKSIPKQAKENFIYGDKSFVSNGTLDYEDAIRDKCSHFPKNEYRFRSNINYRYGWIEASKKC